MRNVAATMLVGLAATVGLAACSSGVRAEDAYKIGCPAVDAAVAGGSLVNTATVAGLKQLRESGALDAEPQRWLDATISLLESDDPSRVSTETKQLIIRGCADNGYPLRNLR